MIKAESRFKRDGRIYLSIHHPDKIDIKVNERVGFYLDGERLEYIVLGWFRERGGQTVILWVR